ncbi:uncharacterized protein Triagg1_10873 [Trichoderma aggressivum f. europaeum]|uniref:Uncharacterized protein n=1 Tax=Trichoderma aggressivum f. europaeum TaxID=173218 RepID=A0AAE1I6H5_9HYPO|nr:hypothetical protein Triagg1_10873 [Trichoderma aggressivum f. europaeum]
MAQNRNPIYVTVPFEDAADANAKNSKVPREQDRVGLWGGSGGGEGKFEVVVVYMDNDKPCYRARERAIIDQSIPVALGSHPSFIRVRLDWPGELRGLPNHVIQYDDVRQIKAHYSQTPREDGGPKDDDWWSYLADTHNFLIRLQDCKQPNGFEMTAILRGQADDLGGLFYVPECHIVVKPGKEKHLEARAQALHRDGKYTPYMFCEEKRAALLRNWFTKRFFVSAVEVGQDTGNWVTIIFDRYVNQRFEKVPHLYILDPNPNGRTERADHTIQVWREILREIGYSSTFMAYVLPLTSRPHDWTTGYIALFSALQAMRGLSGQNTAEIGLSKEFDVLTRYFLPPVPGPDHITPAQLADRKNRRFLDGGKSDLRFRDWCISITRKGPVTDKPRSLDWVLHHLVACAAMELGIRKHTAFTEAPLRNVCFNLEPLASNIERWGTLDAKDHRTIFGGFNPVCPPFATQQRFGVSMFDVARDDFTEYGPGGRPLYLLRRRAVQTIVPTKDDCNPNMK